MRAHALVLGLALCALPAAALSAPGAWTVDKAASKLAFSTSVSGQGLTGAFKAWDAVIHFDPKDLAHSDVSATIDVASAATGNGDADALLPDEDWLWTSHFPEATFTAKSFRAIAPGRYEAAGVLTLRGVSHPLTFPFSLAITGPVAKMSAQIALNRLAFGIGQGEWKATDTVPAAVTVNIALTAHR